MEERTFFVYILTNAGNRILYTGVTNDIFRRLSQHRSGKRGSFSKKYQLDKLVFLELHSTAYDAITREKQIKGGSRKKKIALIESANPTWCDLSLELSDSVNPDCFVGRTSSQ